MGVYLHLCVQTNAIEPTAWAAAYQESLLLLKACPLGLTHIRQQTKQGVKRYIYSTDLVFDKGSDAEAWRVNADLFSHNSCETFELYKNLNVYKQRSRDEIKDKNVFFVEDMEHLRYSSSANGMDIWGDKTNNEPFELALLAVGILLENRFPNKCVLVGYYHSDSADAALQWTNQVLGTNFMPLFSEDALRLWHGVREAYPDNLQHSVLRFTALYDSCSQMNLYPTLLEIAGKEAAVLYQAFEMLDEDDFRDFTGGKIDSFIKEGANVADLIAIFKQTNQLKKQYKEEGEKVKLLKLEDLLDYLCKHYVLFDDKKRKHLSMYCMIIEDEEQRKKVFENSSFKYGFRTPDITSLCTNSDELLNMFCLAESKKQAVFKKIIEKYEQEATELLKNLKAAIGKIAPRPAPNADHNRQYDFAKFCFEYEAEKQEKANNIAQTTAQYPEIDHFFYEYALNVTETPQISVEKVREIGADLRTKIQGEPISKTILEHKKTFYKISHNHNIILNEPSWAAFDNLKNIELLQILTAYISIKNYETKFYQTRKAILDQPDFWTYL